MLSPWVLAMRLSAAKSLALRRGVWWRLKPTARALIDSVLLHLRRGGRVRSQALLAALEEAVRQAALTLRQRAVAIGMAAAARLGIKPDEELALALGLQLMNTPARYRPPAP